MNKTFFNNKIRKLTKGLKDILSVLKSRLVEKNIAERAIYEKEFEAFKKASVNNRFSIKEEDKNPILNEKNKTTGFDKHYVYHTAWAARKLKTTLPKKHIDISSYTYFSTLVSAFIPIEFYEFNPAKIDLSNFFHDHIDITNLPFDDNSIESISSMHVVEHIGLGRYGDPIDPDGDIKAISELKRVTTKGGHILFVIPIGGQAKVMFNAHRIYTYKQIMSYFINFELVQFALIPDKSTEAIIENATEEQSNVQDYGCGCFLFKK